MAVDDVSEENYFASTVVVFLTVFDNHMRILKTQLKVLFWKKCNFEKLGCVNMLLKVAFKRVPAELYRVTSDTLILLECLMLFQ